jgi:hypothetical protein
MRRQDDAPATKPNQIREASFPLDVDVFRSGIKRGSENALPLLFRPPKGAALPRGAARHDYGAGSAGQRPLRVWIPNRVQTELDHVRIRDAVALSTQLGRRGGRQADAKSGCKHKKSLFNRSG